MQRFSGRRAVAASWLGMHLLACGSGAESPAGAGGSASGSPAAAGNGNGAGPSAAGSSGAAAIPPSAGNWKSDYRDGRVDVTSEGNDCSVDPALLETSSLARVEVGDSTIYVGYDQVSADNQDPVVARVDGGKLRWCRHHEDDGPDGRALGITWDGGSSAYVVYTIVGGGSDLEMDGWFRSYGGHAAISGGGSKVSVLGRVDADTGQLSTATHIIAIKTDRKVNTHTPSGAARVLQDGAVELYGSSAHKALGADGKNPMDCSDYPFNSRYRFSADLKTLQCAECSNCTGNVLACD